jgi:hypothetical protein
MRQQTKNWIDEFGDRYDKVILAMNSQLGPYPQHSSRKPVWKDSFTSKDVAAFEQALTTWENLDKAIVAQRKSWNEKERDLNECMREYLEFLADMKAVPEPYREGVWSCAWSRGHASGWGDVYCNLSELVNIFKP